MRRKSRRRLSPVNGRGPEGRRSNEFSRTICCMSPTEEFIDQTILFLKLITPELIKLLFNSQRIKAIKRCISERTKFIDLKIPCTAETHSCSSRTLITNYTVPIKGLSVCGFRMDQLIVKYTASDLSFVVFSEKEMSIPTN